MVEVKNGGRERQRGRWEEGEAESVKECLNVLDTFIVVPKSTILPRKRKENMLYLIWGTGLVELFFFVWVGGRGWGDQKGIKGGCISCSQRIL